MQYLTKNGWMIEFEKNIHMFYHRLKATKQGQVVIVPCEDTPENFVGIWTHELPIGPAESSDLLEGLREWAEKSGLNYRLYRTKEDYEASSPGRRFIASLMWLLLIALVLFCGYKITR